MEVELRRQNSQFRSSPCHNLQVIRLVVQGSMLYAKQILPRIHWVRLTTRRVLFILQWCSMQSRYALWVGLLSLMQISYHYAYAIVFPRRWVRTNEAILGVILGVSTFIPYARTERSETRISTFSCHCWLSLKRWIWVKWYYVLLSTHFNLILSYFVNSL